jgi:hypothetical protein
MESLVILDFQYIGSFNHLSCMRVLLIFLLFAIGSTASAHVTASCDTSISQLKFLNEYVVRHNQEFRSTTIGGLSGIDYDQANNVYYVLTDDRSSVNSARYYTVRIPVSEKGIDTVEFVDFNYLTQADGTHYPDARKDPTKTVDFEALRYNFRTKQIVVASEGERIVRDGRSLLSDPRVITADLKGHRVGEYILPDLLKMAGDRPWGPRQNGALEGLAFNEKCSTLFVALEEPLYQDGPPATTEKTNSWTRIFYFDSKSGKNIKQVAYPLDPVAYPPTPSDAFSVNGVSEIAWLDKDKFLVVERSFSTGRLGCTVKVFLANATSASDVVEIPSLAQAADVKPALKRLLLNMEDIGIYIDNIEGVTFGPKLPNGHRTLIFVSDNNFAPIEKTQFLIFEVIP